MAPIGELPSRIAGRFAPRDGTKGERKAVLTERPERREKPYHAPRSMEHGAVELLEREPLLAQLEAHRRQAAAGRGRLALVGGGAAARRLTR